MSMITIASIFRISAARFLAGGMLSLLLTAGLLSGCANTIPPEGGPKDETPPAMDTAKSTPNYQTNFSKQLIELTFDEWVSLEDIGTQIIVSPPLEYPFDARLRGRTLRFRFAEEEVLREKATYTINFGESVKDLTEQNPAEDLRFVFATGDELDSLELSGTIVDAITGEPQEDVLFLLYDNLADSVVRTQKPFYFGNTSKDGRFRISNIKDGTFKGFALKDSGSKYLFDQSTEPIGFPDSLITLAPNRQTELTIRLFEEARPLRLVDADTSNFGLVRLVFNQPPETLDIRAEGVSQDPAYEFDRDTVRVWYGQQEPQPWFLYLQQDSTFSDTVRVPAGLPEEWLDQSPLVVKSSGPAAIRPNQPLELRFNHPLAEIDTNLVSLTADTTRTPVSPNFSIDSTDRLQLNLANRWVETLPYQLEILPGAVIDIFGIVNADTIRKDFKINPPRAYGNVIVNASGLDSLHQYVFQLNGKDGNTISEIVVSNKSEVQHRFSLLNPGEYILRIIADRNRNGRWDTGNYDDKRQPEPIILDPLDQLRANWDLEKRVALPEGF